MPMTRHSFRRSIWWPRLAALVIAPPACYLAYLAGIALGPSRSSPVPTHVAIGLEVSSTDLDLGEVWETDRLVKRLPIRNRGSESVRVATLTSGCSCVSPESASVVIAPGSTGELDITLDLRNTCASARPGEPRDVRLPLALAVDPSSASFNTALEFRGRVKPVVVGVPRAVDFGRTPVVGQPEARAASVRACVDLASLGVTTDHPAVVAEIKPGAQPREWDLAIRRATGLPPGRYSATVEIKPVLVSGGALPPVRVPVAFDLLADVQPDSPTLSLEPCAVGSVAEGRVTLNSLSGRPFRIEGWTTDPASHLEVIPGEPVGVARSFTVRNRVVSSGESVGRVTFTGQDADARPVREVVEVRAYGLTNP